MDDSFVTYLHQLELIAFFSGYPLIYAILYFVTGSSKPNRPWGKLYTSSLPLAYALVATMYIGFGLMNLSPFNNIGSIRPFSAHHLIVTWGILGVLFWIPALSKKPALSLLHSLVFFALLIKDLLSSTPVADRSIISNDMTLYTASLFLNLLSVSVIVLVRLSCKWLRKRKRASL